MFKHSVLCLLLEKLQLKESPFTVLDTHAGAGIYDLKSIEAAKTGEAKEGAERIFHKPVILAHGYEQILRQLNPFGLQFYPGSPEIVRTHLRPNDKLVACELRKDDWVLLKSWGKSDLRISIHNRDGYEAINAFVPPFTRRGLVFIDPPFERADEFEMLARALNIGLKKWKTGIFVAWYPIKDKGAVLRLRKHFSPDNPPAFACEFLRETQTSDKLVGSGLLICNPPWKFDQELLQLCEELKSIIGKTGSSHSLTWWTNE